MNKRFLSLLLALLMVVSLLPTAAFAAVRDEDPVPLVAPAAHEDTLSTPAAAVDAAEEVPAVAVEDDVPVVLAAVTNIAQGKETSASSDTDSGFPSERAVDGDDANSSSSYWATGWGSTQLPSWLQIDLGAGASATVENMVIKFRNDQYSNDYTIATSATAAEGSWTTVYTLSNRSGAVNNQEDTISYTDGSSGLTQNTLKRYVRITFTTMAQPTKSLSVLEWKIYGELTENGTPDGNLCRLDGVTATASATDATSHGAEKAIDGDTTTTRWASETAATAQAPQWLKIDLGQSQEVSRVNLFWEQTSVTAYTLQVSTDDVTWDTVYTCNSRLTTTSETIEFAKTAVRYLKVNVTAFDDQGSAHWASVSLYEVEAYRDSLPETPSRNLCRPTDGVTVTATASSKEADSVRPANAIDGDSTSSSSRWGSAVGNGPHWLKIDLGTERAVSVVKIFWERRNVLAYTLEGSVDGQNWTTLYTCSSEITTVNETLTFAPVAIRYLRVNITSHKSTGIKWDGTESVNWNTVSLFEVEAYRDANAIPQAASDVLANLQAVSGGPLEVNAAKTKVVLKQAALDLVPEGFTVTFAANLEQVVGAGGVIYTPVVDKVVAIDLTVTDSEGTSASTPADEPISITIPRKPAENETEANNAPGNPKPAVIPEIMEWYSHGTVEGYYNESYTLGSTVRILYRYAFDSVAKELQADLEDLFGVNVTLKRISGSFATLQGEDPENPNQPFLKNGDIILFDQRPEDADPRKRVQGYDDETYGMEIYGGKVYIYATHPTGAYWGTRTLLQGMKLSEGGRSFPNGTLRDYPEFKLRGFVLDVGRKPMSMNMLQAFVKNMAWYKLNDFHVHLNDNLITMEDYKTNEESWDDDEVYKRADLAYSAFRLESNIQEEAGAIPLTAKDYHYTKAEYKAFVENSAKLGVTIMSEIDVPAHAKAITDAFPSLQLRGYRGSNPMAQNHPYNDHLDLSTQEKHDASVNKTKEIFDEYLDAGIFGNSVHFGADEYYASGTPYRRYVKDMINYLKDKKNSAMPNLTIRQWGSLTQMSSSEAGLTDADLKLIVDGVQMNVWNTGWANPLQMYNLGYDLINTVDYDLYIVPGAGYYNDYLPHNLYNNWTPNCFSSTWLPASSDQVLGAAFAIWNDLIDTQANGFSEEEIFDRFFDAIPYISVKMWGEGSELDRPLAEVEANAAIIGLAPRTNPYYETGKTGFFTYDFTDNTDKSGNGHDLTLTNAEINSSKSILILNGGASYAETGLSRLGWGNQLSFRALKLTGGGEEEILFEADHAYGDFSIKALPVEGDATKWKLGFSRELYDYEFGVELPLGKWVSITLTNEPQSTKLSVDGGTPVAAVGKFVSKPDSNTQFWGKTGITSSSFELPVARIGSKKNAFRGYIAAVTTGEPIEVPDAFLTATAPSEKRVPASSNPVEGPASYAVDGDLNTMWHSNYSGDTPDNPNDLRDKPEKRYIQLNLAAPVTVSGLSYIPRSDVSNGTVTSYRIEVSTDGEAFTSVASGDWARTADKKTVTFDAPQQDVIAVRLYGVTTYSNNQYMSALEVELAYDETITLTNANTAITVGDVTWGETAATAEITVALKPSGFVLTEGTDYTVSYANNNTAAAEATATITGTGSYTGSVTATFTVPAKPVDLSTAANVTFAQASYPLESGKAEPEPIVKVGNTTLLRGLDYTVTYANNTAVGTATATVTGIGDYTGEKTATFTVTAAIVKKDLSNTAKTKVTLSQTTFPYDGVAITPEPVVTYDGEPLVKGTDYTVSYARNNAVGTATVTVTGRAPYCEGSASATFTIVDPAKGNDLGDVNKTVVTLKTTQYEYTGQPITPIPSSVRYNGVRLTQGTDYTISYLNNTSGGTGVLVITGIGDYYGSYFAIFTITGGAGAGDTPGSDPGNNSGGSSSGGSSSGSGIPSVGPTTTEITKGDGVTTIVKTDPFGAMLTQSTYDDGTKVIADIPVTGPVTAVVTVPNRVETVTVTIPTRGEPTPGQVAVILHPDGTEEIVKTSLPTEGGVELTLDASATVQVVDNTKSFTDVPVNSWAKDAIDFVTSREIFNGTGGGTFTPTGDMSRAMVCTVLANLAGEDTKGGATWYEKSINWAKQSGISDGSTPNATVTREQLAAMLYRYAGSPTVSDEVPRRFRDRDAISDWAEIAVTWAVQNDLIHGRGSDEGLDLAPQATATRAEVAAVLQRYVALLK